jgi:hypothetical protein
MPGIRPFAALQSLANIRQTWPVFVYMMFLKEMQRK